MNYNNSWGNFKDFKFFISSLGNILLCCLTIFCCEKTCELQCDKKEYHEEWCNKKSFLCSCHEGRNGFMLYYFCPGSDNNNWLDFFYPFGLLMASLEKIFFPFLVKATCKLSKHQDFLLYLLPTYSTLLINVPMSPLYHN